MSDLDNFTPELTQDGSFTFISQQFGEAFHSHFGAKQESFLKFAVPTQLATKSEKGKVRLLDVCYGLGYNTAAALQVIWQANPSCYVEVIGLEINPKVAQAAIIHNLFDGWNFDFKPILTKLAFDYHIECHRLKATLLINDARKSIIQLHQSGFQADAIFLDPFSPPQCPQLWTVEFIQQLSQCLCEDGLLATYSCAAPVRSALLAAGLEIASTPPVGRRTPGTIAAYPKNVKMNNSSTCNALSQREIEHLQTRAAIPYRDPQLNDCAEVILERRQQEQQTSSLEPTSQWRKRMDNR